MAKGGLQRQRFKDKQQRNRIVSQLENLYQQGYSADEVRGMGNKASQYVVTDKDDIAAIAEKNALGVNDILTANPNMTAPKTGMVINIPANGIGGDKQSVLGASNSIGGDKQGGIGLPSAGPLGVAPGGLSTTNAQPGGQVSMWGGTTPGYNTTQKRDWQTNPFAKYEYKPPTTGAWNPNAFATPLEQYTNSNYQPPTAQPRPGAPATQPATTLPRVRQFAPRENHVTLLDSITNQVGMLGAVPSALQLKLLINSGRVKPTNQNNFGGGGGGGNYRRFGSGGGRGGGGNRATGGYQQQEPRLPAFSNGGGFRGLVNWRI